jgi:signal transduction histidine kinase
MLDIQNSPIKKLMYFMLFFLSLLLATIVAVGVIFVKDIDEHAQKIHNEIHIIERLFDRLNQKAIPTYIQLERIKTLSIEFDHELELLSIDGDQSRERISELMFELEEERKKLLRSWPKQFDRSLYDRINNYIFIIQDIGNELLESHSPNFILQLFSDTEQIIHEIVADEDAIIKKTLSNLRYVNSQTEHTEREAVHLVDQIESGFYLFLLVMCLIIFLFVYWLQRIIGVINTRLNLLKNYAQQIEAGHYDTKLPFNIMDATGDLANSIESMSGKLVLQLEQNASLAEKAKQSSVAKSEFLASMSHEIRTPMNGVLGMLNILAASELSSEQKHHLALANSSASSLLLLIDDILDFSKIESGKLTIESAPFNLNTMLNDFISIMVVNAEQKGLSLTLDTSGIFNEWVCGDSNRIRQILTNLVGNALKFTESGSIQFLVGE